VLTLQLRYTQSSYFGGCWRALFLFNWKANIQLFPDRGGTGRFVPRLAVGTLPSIHCGSFIQSSRQITKLLHPYYVLPGPAEEFQTSPHAPNAGNPIKPGLDLGHLQHSKCLHVKGYLCASDQRSVLASPSFFCMRLLHLIRLPRPCPWMYRNG
jgi:hypothetical protein